MLKLFGVTILSGKLELTWEDIRRFVAATERFAIQGFIDPLYERATVLSMEESNKNLIEHITTWMNNNL